MDSKKYEMLSRREKDEQDEKIVGNYLDKHFYPLFCKDWNRNINDLPAQFRGEDITITTNNDVKYIIDEKAATGCIGRNLQTFLQEISNINKAGSVQYGTYINPNNTNNAYVFIWIDEAVTTNDKHLIKREDGADTITDITIALIDKKTLKDYVASLGWTDYRLWKKQESIRQAYREHGSEWWKYVNMGDLDINGCKFFFGCKFYEQSVDLLLPRTKLIEIANEAYRIKNQNPIKL